MTDERMVRADDGLEYVLVERLGGGAIAAVYRGETASGRVAAVKLSHAIHPDLRKQFNTEFETLNRILEAGADWPGGANRPPVPAFAKRADKDALVVEFVDAPSLGSQIQGDDLAVRQEKLAEPAWHYAWLLDLLHNPEVDIGQLDRKGPDLRWDAEDKRLVVLDWNLVSDAERAPEDVYQFGAMWYAFFLDVPPLLGADYTAHPQWEDLSVAWREVLKACLRVNRSTRPSAAQLLATLEDLRQDYQQPALALLRAGQQALAQATESAIPERWQTLSRAWRQLDLAWRRGSAEAEAPAARAQALVEGLGETAIQEAKEYLEVGRYIAAEAPLRQAAAELGENIPGQLRVARWLCLYEASQVGMQADAAHLLRSTMPDLIHALAKFESGEWHQVTPSLSTALERFPKASSARHILSSLASELELRQVLQEACNLQQEAAFGQAARKYDDALEILPKILYQDALARTLPDLADARVDCEVRAQTEEKRNRLLAGLSTAVKEGSYGEARRLYLEALPLTAADPAAQQALADAFAPVEGLEQVHQLRQQADLPYETLVERIQELSDRFPGQPAVQQMAGQVIVTALDRLEEQAKLARLPLRVESTVELGLRLQRLIRNLEPSVSQSGALSRCALALAAAEEKRNLQRQLRPAFEQADERGEIRTRDEIIGRARMAGIEIYDEPWRSLDDLSEHGAKELQRQELQRLTERTRQLAEELEAEGQRFVEAGQDLEERARRLRKRLDDFLVDYKLYQDRAGQQISELATEQQRRADEQLKQLQAALDQQATEAAQSGKQFWMRLSQQAKQAAVHQRQAKKLFKEQESLAEEARQEMEAFLRSKQEEARSAQQAFASNLQQRETEVSRRLASFRNFLASQKQQGEETEGSFLALLAERRNAAGLRVVEFRRLLDEQEKHAAGLMEGLVSALEAKLAEGRVTTQRFEAYVEQQARQLGQAEDQLITMAEFRNQGHKLQKDLAEILERMQELAAVRQKFIEADTLLSEIRQETAKLQAAMEEYSRAKAEWQDRSWWERFKRSFTPGSRAGE